MVRAYPTDPAGEQCGKIQSFTDEKWARLTTLKPFRWKVAFNKSKSQPQELIGEKSPAKKTEETPLTFFANGEVDIRTKKDYKSKSKRKTKKNK